MLTSHLKWIKSGVFALLISISLSLVALEVMAQKFDQNSYYRLVAKHSGKVLDVNLGKGDQANVVQHSWHGGDNQRWKIERVDGNGGGTGKVLYKSRWDQIGGTWTTGWKFNQTIRGCGHQPPQCQACSGQSRCGIHQNNAVIVVAPYGVKGDCKTKWKLRCTSVPQ